MIAKGRITSAAAQTGQFHAFHITMKASATVTIMVPVTAMP